MPVLLQTLHDTSDPALLEQLSKIYHDAEPERLQQSGQENVAVEDFIRNVLTDETRSFYCALFNERLIGALVIHKPGDDAQWAMSHLCVRKVTRRRGVGSRLLALTLQAAKDEGTALIAPADALMTPDHIILQRMGYQLTEQSDGYLLNHR